MARQHVANVDHAGSCVLCVATVWVAVEQLRELAKGFSNTRNVALRVITGDERREKVFVEVVGGHAFHVKRVVHTWVLRV